MESTEIKDLIYIVEDHEVIATGVKQYLEMSDLKCEVFFNLSTAREGFAKQKPALLIQDVMLPDGDGFEFVRELKKEIDIPVIFMTARGEESDRILGFELGADDYITKPFSPKELVLRVKAILKRCNPNGGEVADRQTFTLENDVIELDRVAHKLHVDDKKVVLTAAEWRVLICLIDHEHLLVTRSQILDECFDYASESYERIVDTHIKNIRAKLGDNSWLETVRGYGYRFVGVQG
ncbi:MAG: response regulator transcription factor [Spirochaetaceae bacterium]|nr:response regulator transcription factor [Spirochaetaceae bacterium]